MFNYDKLEQLRKEKGISKKFIAEKIGRTGTTYQDWKNKKCEPSDEQLAVIAQLLDTTSEYLRDEEPLKEPLEEQKEKTPSSEAEKSKKIRPLP